MGGLVLAVGYVIVVLHEFWSGADKPVPVGTVLEVTRSERNALVSGHVARDATDVEIAEFRGEPLPEEVLPDAGEALAALEEARGQILTLETQRDELQSSVDTLKGEKVELAKSVGELGIEVDNLKAANEAQAKALEGKKAAK